MSQHHFNAPKPAFGRMQGAGVAMPRHGVATPAWNAPSGAPQAAVAATAVPQVPNYADIVGDAFTGRSSHSDGSTERPVKGLRFLSGIIDFIAIVIIGAVIIFMQVGTGAASADIAGDGMVEFYLIFALACFAYGFLLEASPLQGTLGKVVTGTVIVNKDGSRMSVGKALGRNLAKAFSTLVPFYIPYMMVLWTQQHQAMHDKMAGTLVYKKGDVPNGYAETFA